MEVSTQTNRSSLPEREEVENGTDRNMFPSEVLSFCHRNGLLTELRTAVELANKCFQPTRWEARLERDPETGEEWVALMVIVPSAVVPVREAYHQYTTQWLHSAPASALYLIRISYDLI